MSRCRRPWLIAALLVLALAAPGCRARTAAGESAGVVVLVDRSGSADPLAGRYTEEFDRLLAGFGGGERLFVLPVVANSSVTPVDFEITFPAYDPLSLSPSGENGFTHKSAMKRLRAEATQQFKELMESPLPELEGTAILDALAQSGSLLEQFPPGRRTVVLLSDMIEQSDLADFTNLRQEQLDGLVEDLKAKHRLPRLDGARVLVAGISDGSGDLSAEQVLTIKQFWSKLFQAAGAGLDWYGPSLAGLAR